MYSSLVVGGTFDHFHQGHEKLLSAALLLSKHVVLGLTMNEMNKKKVWSDLILPYEDRKREISTYLESVGRLDDVDIIPITDVFGTTLEDTSLEAIVVTSHTRKGAEAINMARKAEGLGELAVHVCELVQDSQNSVLSSTRIRSGLVNRSGFAYASLFPTSLILSEEIKAEVRKPLGDVYLTFPTFLGAGSSSLVFVGDVVTKTAVQQKMPFASAWIDGQSSRAPYRFAVFPPYIIKETGCVNAPGTIDHMIARYMEEHLVGKNTVYKIDGEEDLLTLVAILLSPLKSMIVYGNPYGQPGVTAVRVTEEKKEEIKSLLETLSA